MIVLMGVDLQVMNIIGHSKLNSMMHDGGGNASTHMAIAHTNTMDDHIVAFINPFPVNLSIRRLTIDHETDIGCHHSIHHHHFSYSIGHVVFNNWTGGIAFLPLVDSPTRQ